MRRPLRPAARGHLPPRRRRPAPASERRGAQDAIVAVRADGNVTSVSVAALELASAAALRPLFVHVARPPSLSLLPAPFAIPTNAAAARVESQTVEEARRVLARAGVDGTRVDVQLGDPVRQVLEVARGHDTALLILGVPAAVRFPRLARSVGQRLIRSAPCPVILVPAGWRAGPSVVQRRADRQLPPRPRLTPDALVDLISSIGAEPVLISGRRASGLRIDEGPTDRLYAVSRS